MERGDLSAVIIGISLVILLTFLLSPAAPSLRKPPGIVTPSPVPTTLATPVQETTAETIPVVSTPPPVPMRRISYTNTYSLYPVRFLPGDMSTFGSSDREWKYNSSVVFAYIEENHGGLTETFTVPYPVWRLTSTLIATRSPENARFRMILVDEESGRILEGAEIRSSGSITKNVAASGRPLYMVIETENVEKFMITLEAPSLFTG
jgi:hypothetical protein